MLLSCNCQNVAAIQSFEEGVLVGAYSDGTRYGGGGQGGCRRAAKTSSSYRDMSLESPCAAV